MALPHEAPLDGFHRRIGGSAGKGTHGGTDISRPEGMPTRDECEYHVSKPREFVSAVQEDGATIYLDKTIGLTGYVRRTGGIDMGSDVAIVGGYCDPDVPGRGPQIVCEENGHRVLESGYGTAPSLWGVSFLGPELEYVDPDHTAPGFDDMQGTGLWSHDTAGTLTVVGCEFRGWSLAGLEIGSRSKNTDAVIERTTFHRSSMEHLGYGIEHYNGDLSLNECFLDTCRHGISGFGYPDCSWSMTNSVVGPGPWSGHALDMHCLANNLSDSAAEKYPLGGDTAGGDILIERCSIMSTWDVGDYAQEGFALRGIPTGEAHINNSHFWHTARPSAVNAQGQAYRQETDAWTDFYVTGNIYGPNVRDGRTDVGAPLAVDRDGDDGDNGNDQHMKLIVDGLGGPGVNGNYEIVVHGDVSGTEQNEPSESIEEISDNRKMISGNMWGGVDEFELAEGAIPVSATFDGVPARILRDGDDITGSLVGNGLDGGHDENVVTESDLEALREWVAGQLNSLEIVSGGGSDE